MKRCWGKGVRPIFLSNYLQQPTSLQKNRSDPLLSHIKPAVQAETQSLPMLCTDCSRADMVCDRFLRPTVNTPP